MSSANLKEQILERLNFEAFYQQELQELKRGSGDNVSALCPFHEDTNPSLSIDLKTGFYHCFGCEASGDIFSFYQKRHGCDFKETLQDLARRAGVEDRPRDEAYLSLTLAAFAAAKKLPLDFLRKWRGVQEYSFKDGITCTDFHYFTEGGKLLAIRHRFANKGELKFRWRKNDKVLPYGLWKLAEIRKKGWCLLVEGETDTLTCWLHGIPALGLPGKKTWKRCRKWLDLQGVQVYLWQEPDAKGLPEEVALDLPDLLVIKAPPDFKDLSEAHCQGRDVKALVEDLKKKARLPAPPAVITSGGFSLSDLGNARRLVARHGRDLRYCHLSKKWYHWTGRHWGVDSSGEVERRAKEVVAEIYQEAAEAKDFKEREALGKFALRTEDSKRILAMVRLAQSELGVPVNPRELDANPWLLNCANGTVDLTTGELRPHAREDLITCLSPVDYDPKAPCDLWERFLWRIQETNQDVIDFIQRAIGYALTGNCREECLFILWGGGANGKTTLINTIGNLLGDYSRNTPIETLLAKNSGGEIPTDVARLDGPRFVTASEVDRGRRLAESLVKALTGRDMISARFLYGEYFDFTPQFKLFLSTNNKPVIKGNDDAIWRRIMFLRFPVQIPKEERDLDLSEKLKAEAPGILAWAVRGCLSWLKYGLEPPAEVIAATEEYRAEMDVLADFLADCCVVAYGLSASSAELYKAYSEWAEEQGMPEKQRMKLKTFGVCLSERGFQRDKGTGGQRLRLGLSLRSI